MKKLFYSIAAIVITATVLISITSFQKQNTIRTAKKPIATKGFVIMELFTSQGCSSCPAADEILGNYAKTDDGNIFPISFHVDYWNRLGWVDSFSNPAYTLRQNEYASKFDLESVYTPQLIINGQKQLTGSDEEKISFLVADFKNAISTAEIQLLKINTDGNKMNIAYAVNDLHPGTIINAALVQEKVVTQIMAGENRGVKMTGYNIVRDFTTSALTGIRGICSLQLPPGYTTAGYHVVLFVQEVDSGKILAAVRSLH